MSYDLIYGAPITEIYRKSIYQNIIREAEGLSVKATINSIDFQKILKRVEEKSAFQTSFVYVKLSVASLSKLESNGKGISSISCASL